MIDGLNQLSIDIELARRPGTLTLVRARFLKALGRVLVGLPGGRVSDSSAGRGLACVKASSSSPCSM